LQTLETHTFVSRNSDGDYLPGPWAYRLARGIIENDHTISMARDVQEQLATATQEAVYLGVLKEDKATLTELVECKKMVRAANCIGESLLITDGDLIGSTPASKIYVARNTLLEEVATITAAVNIGAGAPSLALVIVLPALRCLNNASPHNLHPS